MRGFSGRAAELHGPPAAGGVFGFKDLNACDKTVRIRGMDPAPRAAGGSAEIRSTRVRRSCRACLRTWEADRGQGDRWEVWVLQQGDALPPSNSPPKSLKSDAGELACCPPIQGDTQDTQQHAEAAQPLVLHQPSPTRSSPHILQINVEGPSPRAGQDCAPAPQGSLAPRHTDVDAGVKRLHMLPLAPHCFHGLGRERGEGREGRAAFARFTGRTSCLQQIVLPSTCILSDRNSWYFQL